MKRTFRKRLEALEERFKAAGEQDPHGDQTECSRSLQERVERGRRRIAAWRERQGMPTLWEGEPWEAGGTLVEVLQAGRERSAMQAEVRRRSSNGTVQG